MSAIAQSGEKPSMRQRIRLFALVAAAAVIGSNLIAGTSSASGNTWSIHMSSSRGWTYDTNLQYASSRSSAEWIHESPSLIAVPLPMGNSNRVWFDGNNTVTTGAGAPVNIAGAAPAAFATD